MTSRTTRSGSISPIAGQGVPARVDGVHLEAGVAQGRLQHRSQVVLVVDEQKPFTTHAVEGGVRTWERPEPWLRAGRVPGSGTSVRALRVL